MNQHDQKLNSYNMLLSDQPSCFPVYRGDHYDKLCKDYALAFGVFVLSQPFISKQYIGYFYFFKTLSKECLTVFCLLGLAFFTQHYAANINICSGV